jgi:N-dimethylarginine dimethylaminohydrolase
LSDFKTGDWRTDQVKLLYLFCREMSVLPSQVYDEDPILMNDMLVIFEEEMRHRKKEQEEIERISRRR